MLKLPWIALVIRRTMTAHGVQHNQNIFVGTAIDVVLQTDQHAFIAAFAILTAFANGIGLRCLIVLIGHTIGHAFGAGVVVTPQNFNTGAFKYVQRVLGAVEFFLAITLAPEIGEHARHRHGGTGSARGHIGKAHQIRLFGQQRIGQFRIAVERPMIGTRSFADDQDNQVKVFIFSRNFRIRADFRHMRAMVNKTAGNELSRRIQIGQRIGIKTHGFMLAYKGRHVFIEHTNRRRHHNQGHNHTFEF